jgi:hypothetical protein
MRCTKRWSVEVVRGAMAAYRDLAGDTTYQCQSNLDTTACGFRKKKRGCRTADLLA